MVYEAVAPLVEASKQAGYARLLATWEANNTGRFCAAMRLSAGLLAAAARDSQVLEPDNKTFLKSAMKAVGLGKTAEQQRQEKAMGMLIERLNQQIGKTTASLLALHKLDPSEAVKINARVRENFAIRAPVDKTQAGLLGAVISGAATGLSADLMAGGLTFGAGALIGGVVGALTLAGAAWGFNTSTDRNHATVQFADAFLQTLLVGSVLRYLAVAHFGRGRGNFVEGEAPVFWQAEVERAVSLHADEVGKLWHAARGDADIEAATERIDAAFTKIAAHTLGQLYPGAALAT